MGEMLAANKSLVFLEYVFFSKCIKLTITSLCSCEIYDLDEIANGLGENEALDWLRFGILFLIFFFLTLLNSLQDNPIQDYSMLADAICRRPYAMDSLR